jgi:pilus assembly protein CpaB
LFKLSLKKSSPKILLIIAVALSLLTAVLIYFYLQQDHKATIANQAVVVVAVREIPARTFITADMLTLANVLPDLVQIGSRRDVESLIGMTTKKAIAAGDQITDVKLAINGQGIGMSGNIPSDKRAFTIAVDEINGAQGFIRVGDFVDVIGIFDKSVVGETASHVLMQNVQVLAINGKDNADAADKDKNKEQGKDKLTSVTLAVSLNDAALLGLAGEKGKIHLALRPFAAAGYDFLDKTIGIDQLVGHPVLPAPAIVPVQGEMLPQAPVYAVPPKSSAAAPVSTKLTGVTVIRGTQIDNNREAQ